MRTTSCSVTASRGPGVVTPGDHLQSTYNLWLPGHQLAHVRAPWKDPYSFQPESPERTNFAGWPFGLVFWPLHALFGTVGAWNAFVLLTYVGAGAAAAAWLRSLQLPLGAALVGGLAFALAPYRSIQTAGGHLLGPIAMLLPLSLWALETRRRWLAVAAIASVPLSGQVHLALGAIVFFLAYAAVRRSPRLGVVGAAALDARRAPRLPRRDPRLDRRRPLVRAGRALLGGGRGLLLAHRPPRVRDLRLRRLAAPARGAGRSRARVAAGPRASRSCSGSAR